jgi:hypothetical protein
MPPDVQTPPAPVTEADIEPQDEAVVPLIERAVSADGTMEVKMIEPGWGSSGYYSAEVLKADAGVAQPGTHMYLDHPTESEARERPERSIKDLAAIIVTPGTYQENGKAGPGVYYRAAVLPQFRDTIEALAPHIGVSIRARGSFKEGEVDGRNGRIVTSIRSLESVDFVTKPGAGGKVLALMESLREDHSTDNDHSGHVEDDAMELKEAQDRISELEGKLTESDGKLTEAQTAAATEKVRADRAETALAAVEAQSLARKALDNIKLPDASKDRIVEAIATNPPLTEGKLDADAVNTKVAESAKTEAEYLERALGTGKVRGMGQSDSNDSAGALIESFTKMYLDQGYGQDEAKKLAATAASGR